MNNNGTIVHLTGVKPSDQMREQTAEAKAEERLRNLRVQSVEIRNVLMSYNGSCNKVTIVGIKKRDLITDLDDELDRLGYRRSENGVGDLIVGW